ncbi:NIPSNAP family protein, partial [Burkholderia sp. E168m30]
MKSRGDVHIRAHAVDTYRPALQTRCSVTAPRAPMITCFLRYVVDPYKLVEFETYGKMWIPLVKQFGGTHHGYFLPSEGASNIALAMFS